MPVSAKTPRILNPKYSSTSDPLKYLLFAVDLDGTLVTDDKQITPATANAIREILEMGMTVALVSGRPTFGCEHIADQLQLAKYGGYIISYNGAKITSCIDNDVLTRSTISRETVGELYDFLKGYPVTMMTYTRHEIITEDADSLYVRQESQIDNGMPIRQVPNLKDALVRDPYKCGIAGDPEVIGKLAIELQERFSGKLNAILSGPIFIEVMSPYVDKGKALSFLMSEMGIERSQVIAVGDANNDIPMLQAAGLGVAMANANEMVKQVADYVTTSNMEEGIQHLLNKYVLHPEQSAAHPEVDFINAMQKDTLMETLGMKCTLLEEGYVECTMPVDRRTCQPMGILHGGASLALAETIAGYGSVYLLSQDETMVGMQVSGSHVHSARLGNTLTAKAKIIHRGRSTHLWDVEIYTEMGTLVSSVRVLNSILHKR